MINSRKKLLIGGAWAFSGRLVTAFTAIGVSVLLTRLLTPFEVGVYFLLFSFVSVMAVISQIGLPQAIVKFVAESIGTEQPERARNSIHLVFAMVSVSTAVVAAFILLGVGEWIALTIFGSHAMGAMMIFAVLWIILLAFQNLITEIFRGLHDIRLATLYGGLISSLITIGLFLVLWFSYGRASLEQVVMLMLVSSLVSMAFALRSLRSRTSVLPVASGIVTTTEILAVSWPIWATSILHLVLTQADLWLLGMFRAGEEVAIYGVVVRFVSLFTVPQMVVNSVMAPIIAEMYSQRKIDELGDLLRATATLAGVPSVLAMVALVIYGGEILGLVYGEYYSGGDLVLTILCAGQLVFVLSGSNGLTLMLTGHQKLMMGLTGVSGLLTIIVAGLLVQSWGGEGVAAAVSLGIMTQNILMLIYVKRKVGIWTGVAFLERSVWRKLVKLAIDF